MKTANRRILESFRSQSEEGVRRGEKVGPKKRNLFVTFLLFLRVMIPYWDKAALCVFIICTMSLVRIIGPWLGKFLIDDAIPNRDWNLFWAIVGARIMLGLVGRFAWTMNAIFMRYVDIWVLIDLKSRFLDHLVRLSMTFMQSRPVGEHMFRANADIWAVLRMITDILPVTLEAMFDFLLVFAFLTYLDWRVTVVVLVYMIPYTWLAHMLASLVRKFDREARGKWQRRDAALQEGVAGMLVVKTFARRRYEVRKFINRTIDGFRSSMKKHYTWIIKQQVIGRWGFVPWIKSWLVRAWFLREVILGHMTYGSFMPIYSYMNRFANPIQRVIDQFQQLRVAMVPAERILETLDIAPVVVDKPNAPRMPPIKGDVKFDDVTFSYEEGIPVLNGLTFEVRAGQKVAFVGHSGAGKSTIVNLLLRLYDPTKGRVLVDGIDLRDVRMESYQRQVGLVFQETYLFGGTIRDNILFGNSHATEEDLMWVIRQADLEEFVTSLPDGLDTDLSEGSALSGGQKQRLGIARAMIRKPKLLILDEPTSSLDIDTEQRVQATLNKVMKGRTTFIISHRLPTVMDADVIFAMDDGRIVESSTHDELLARAGYYYQLYTLYFSGKRSDVA